MDRSEKPTPQKIAKFKKKVGGAQSVELGRSLVLLVGVGVLYWSRGIWERGFRAGLDLTTLDPLEGLKRAFSPFLWFSVAFLGVIFLVTAGSFVVQRGWVFNFAKKPVMKEGKLYRFCFSLMKLLLLAVGLWGAFSGVSLLRWGMFMCLGFLCLGFVDWGYKKWRFMQELKMTRAEVKEEAKE